MSKLSKTVKEEAIRKEHHKDETVVNFMGGESFELNPLETLKMISASSIFGEPSYYRDGKIGRKIVDARYKVHSLVKDAILPDKYNGMTTTDIFEKAIDDALDYDFGATLEWASELRHDFYMRLNPQVIMVRASIHPKRAEWTKENEGRFSEIEQRVMSRADEPMTQLTYYIYKNGGISNMPTILKKSIKKKLNGLSRYEVSKYKNHEIGMINAVRLTHAHSDVLNELMETGTVSVDEDEKTWENLRSGGMDWKTIYRTVKMGHMALLRNIRGVFEEVDDLDFCKEYMENIKAGVLKGKQFPFRYLNAINAVNASKCNHKPTIIDALEECMDIAVANMPKLSGKTMCLSDNSGSAWGTIPTEYGSVKVAEIDNLSSVITAMNSDEGYVGRFGDKITIHPISKRNGVLTQANEISKNAMRYVGGSTEGGIWEFFINAIRNKEHWDNIFIYSDQQAGHGGLYGTSSHKKEYSKLGFCCGYAGSSYGNDYINVFDLVLEYRKKVNPKVNVFSIQTAGYNNVVVPENCYRTSILYGWTGKELVYADAINKMWDSIDQNKN